MKDSRIIKEMKNKKIKWVFFAGIDNVLMQNVDTMFLGMIIKNNMSIGSKSIFKEEPLARTAIYCKKDGRPAILDYDEIDFDLSESKNDAGEYLYREANILAHIMSLEAIEFVSKKELPYHRAYKKNPIINEEGMKIIPTSPNTFKFENFIFDAFSFFNDMLLLRVEKQDEFAPIKDFTGIYTPETAKEAYERKYSEYGKK
jgi:UDP-N-acetylglucosamine pyrophosphorylase